MSESGALRIGTTEREHAAAVLADHFAAGRLDTDEFDERVRQVYFARTDADLAPLFVDLPVARPEPDAHPVRRRRPRRPVSVPVVLLLAAAVWVAVVNVSPLLLLPVLWVMVASHRSRRAWGRPSPVRCHR